jgi:hypothetical protein
MPPSDPTTPDGINFIFGAEAQPVGDDPDPCVFCNHPDIIPERKVAMAAKDEHASADDIPDEEAMCRADYVFQIGNSPSVEIPVCEGCLYDMPVEYGDSSAFDLPFAWQDEVVLKTQVPRLDADQGSVHRSIPVALLADLSTDLTTGD